MICNLILDKSYYWTSGIFCNVALKTVSESTLSQAQKWSKEEKWFPKVEWHALYVVRVSNNNITVSAYSI